MIIIDIVFRCIKGAHPEPDKGVSPWLIPILGMVFFVFILLVALLFINV